MKVNKISLFTAFACLLLVTFAPNAFAKTVKYKWQQQYYGQQAGKQSLLFARQMPNSKLAFADIDGDGDQDVFMGQKNGEIAYFENKGSDIKPEFVLITQQYKAIFELKKKGRKVQVWNKIDIGERSAPFLVDIDFDGDYDLFIGTAEGRIWHFENRGNNLIPVFKLVSAKFQNITIGKNLVPIFFDVNLSRKFDLLVGSVDGKVWLYTNNGTRKKPDFKSSKPVNVVTFGLETHAAPGLVDWDGDQDLDLVVGSKNGTLTLFTNEGDRFFPDWKLSEERFQRIDIGGESAPVFMDLDGDHDDDMVIGSANPTASLYENRTQAGAHVLWNITTNLFNFNKLVITGTRGSIATGDLDGDKDLDLIVGETTGNLNYFENISKTKAPDWILKTEDLIYMTGMKNSAPTLGDLDGDGDLDLLIGERSGQVAFVENIGTPQKPEWKLQDKTYFQIDVGSNAVPRLHDYDKDGDLDLFVGNFTGRVILYKNKGTKKAPIFALESTRFASAKVERNSVPAFFDWNQDQFLDLVLGGLDGKLMLHMSPSAETKDNLNWEVDDKSLMTFEVDSLAHPIFDDFNGDGDPDLLIGNDEGDFLLYLNMGVEKEDEALQVIVDNSIDSKSGSLVVENVEGPIELDISEDVEQDEEEELEITEESMAIGQIQEEIQVVDPKWVRVSIPLIRNDRIRRSTPTFGDLDLDGDLDMLVGTRTGNVFYFENVGNDQEWEFTERSDDYLKTKHLRNTSPLLTDLDQDGDLDLILGAYSGQLSYYQNQGTNEEPRFVLDKAFFRNLWIGENAKPAVLDLNGDSVLDLLIGNLWGKLIYVKNDSDRFVIIRRDYQLVDIGIGSTPAFSDLNNSGKPELLLGSDAGPVYFLRNTQDNYSGKWELLEDYGGKMHFPKGSTPVGFDLDADGDKDLITGSDVGLIFMYRNDAITRELDEEQAATTEEE